MRQAKNKTASAKADLERKRKKLKKSLGPVRLAILDILRPRISGVSAPIPPRPKSEWIRASEMSLLQGFMLIEAGLQGLKGLEKLQDYEQPDSR